MSRVRDLADNNVVFVDGITTADITEHTNLFFTDARADARLALKMVDEDNMSSNSAAHMPTQQSVKAYVDTEVASLVDSSPSTLDTLNELAAALGDDANFSTTITNSIATKMPAAGGTFTGDVTFDGDAGNIVFDKSHDSLSFFQAAALKFVSTSATNQQSRIQWDGTRTHWETFNNTRVDLDGDFRLVGQSYNVEWDKSANALEFADNAKATFGAGSDLQIYHDGNSKITDVGDGKLELHSNGTGVTIQKGATEYMAQFLTDGAVQLYYDNAQKFATTASGIDVTGTVTADGYFGDGGATSNITFSQATSTSNPSVALWGRDHSSYPGQVHIVGRNSNANTSSGDIRFWNYNGSTWYNMFRFAYDTDNSDTRTTLQTITDTNTAIVSTQSIYNIIDSNNNQTDRAFFVSCNSDRPGNATTIIKAGEDRNIVFGQNDAAGMYNGTGSNGFGVQQAGLGGQYVVVQNTTDSNLYLSKHSSYSDSRCIQFSIGGTTKGSVTVASSGTTYNTTSDLRLKTDIKPIKNATIKLLEMNPVEHKWKANPQDDAVHGFIAQEMKEIVPEAVYGEPNGDEMMSMDYGRITPVVVAALQDALKEINELKGRISELENK